MSKEQEAIKEAENLIDKFLHDIEYGDGDSWDKFSIYRWKCIAHMMVRKGWVK